MAENTCPPVRRAVETATEGPPRRPVGSNYGSGSSRVKFEVYGEEMIEKRVKASGNSGRIYLPPEWVGHRVKITRID